MGEDQLLQALQRVLDVQRHQTVVGQVEVLQVGEVLEGLGGEGHQMVGIEQQDACVLR